MEGIVLRFDKETGQGLLRSMEMRPPRPLRFEVTTKKLKSQINRGTKVTFDAERGAREAINVAVAE